MKDGIVVCLAICVIGFGAVSVSRSRYLQRLGVTGLLLTAAVAGSGIVGMRFAQNQMTQQYFSLLCVYFENMYSYAGLLEEAKERSQAQEEEERLRRWLDESLPVAERGKDSVQYLAAEIWELEDGVYRRWISAGKKRTGDSGGVVKELAREAAGEGRVAWRRLSDDEGCLVLCDRNRTAPRYAVAVYIPLWPLQEKCDELRRQYFVYGVIFLAAGSLLAGAALFLQECEIIRVISLLTAVAEGREGWERLKQDRWGNGIRSSETRLLYQSLRQLAERAMKTDYRRYQALLAYYRFAPKEVERILEKQSILDVRPSDSVHVEGILAFVSFFADAMPEEEEQLQQINDKYALLDRVCQTHGGIVLSAENDLGALQILFRETAKQAVAFGLELAAKGGEAKEGRPPLILLHKTSFFYGVAGDEKQTYPYIHSGEMKVLQRYADELCAMGVRMAVTDRVYEIISHERQSRYIGFVEGNGYTFRLYEILDAYPVKERLGRTETGERFREAMQLFYQDDFYLSRNLFTEVVKSCPSDAAAKRYVFLCESCLRGDVGKVTSHALFCRERDK